MHAAHNSIPGRTIIPEWRCGVFSARSIPLVGFQVTRSFTTSQEKRKSALGETTMLLAIFVIARQIMFGLDICIILSKYFTSKIIMHKLLTINSIWVCKKSIHINLVNRYGSLLRYYYRNYFALLKGTQETVAKQILTHGLSQFSVISQQIFLFTSIYHHSLGIIFLVDFDKSLLEIVVYNVHLFTNTPMNFRACWTYSVFFGMNFWSIHIAVFGTRAEFRFNTYFIGLPVLCKQSRNRIDVYRNLVRLIIFLNLLLLDKLNYLINFFKHSNSPQFYSHIFTCEYRFIYQISVQ